MLMYGKDVEDRSKLYWEIGLDISLLDSNYSRISFNGYKISNHTANWRNSFKVQHLWHYIPEILNKLYPIVVNQCWRCKQQHGISFLHTWWT